MVQDIAYSLPVPPQQNAAFRRPQRSNIVPMQNNNTFVPRPPSAAPVPQQSTTVNNCECHHHNPTTVASNNSSLTVTLKETNQKDVIVPVEFFPMTTALRSILESAEKGAATVEVSVRQLCKLFDEGKCRHRLRCKNVHICATKKAEITAMQREETALEVVNSVAQQKKPVPPVFDIERPTMSTSPMPHPPKCDSPKAKAPAFRRLTPPVSIERDSSNPASKCLARFVRRWNNPNIANSGDSNLSLSAVSLSADVSDSRSSIPKLPPIFMSRERDSFHCSSPAVMAMLRTPTPADERDECFFGIAC